MFGNLAFWMLQMCKRYWKKMNGSQAYLSKKVFSNVASLDQNIPSLFLNLKWSHKGGQRPSRKAKEWRKLGPHLNFPMRNCKAQRRIISFLGDISFVLIGLGLQWRTLGSDVPEMTLKFWTLIKLIFCKWGNIIFLITTSQGYLKSKNNYLNIE